MKLNRNQPTESKFVRLIVLRADELAKLAGDGQTQKDQQRLNRENSEDHEQSGERVKTAADPG